jgi:3-oxoacyl-[acyl-carrier-protein] synthase-3
MRIDRLFLAGIGTALPPSIPAGEAVARNLYDRDAWLRDGWTGAADAGDTPAPDLAVAAAQRALAQSGLEPAEIVLVLHACCLHQGPDLWPAAHYVQRHTIGGSALTMEIRQNCTGMLGAMELASAYLAASDQSAALITGADNFGNPLINRWRYVAGGPTGRGSVLGDAGSAVLLSRRRGFARLLAIGSTSLPDLEELHRGDHSLFPPECTQGSVIDLGARFAEFATRHPDDFMAAGRRLQQARTALATQVLAEARVKPADIVRATHVFSGGYQYVRSVLEPIGVDPARGMTEFGRGVGHLGVNDHIVALDHLLNGAEIGAGDHILMIGNAPGIAISCAVLEILEVPAAPSVNRTSSACAGNQ